MRLKYDFNPDSKQRIEKSPVYHVLQRPLREGGGENQFSRHNLNIIKLNTGFCTCLFRGRIKYKINFVFKEDKIEVVL